MLSQNCPQAFTGKASLDITAVQAPVASARRTAASVVTGFSIMNVGGADYNYDYNYKGDAKFDLLGWSDCGKTEVISGNQPAMVEPVKAVVAHGISPRGEPV